jgi:hypothetical protein
VVEHRAGGDEVERAGVDGPRDDVALDIVEVGRGGRLVDEGQVDVDRYCLPGRPDELGQPFRHRAVAEADLERPCAGADPERFDVAPVHRVE